MSTNDPEERGRSLSASYTKKGPGRRHREGRPRKPFDGTAHEISEARQLRYMHAVARRYHLFAKAIREHGVQP